MRTWFHAIFLMSATRCGISAMQLMRETGVTYKTAWRMFNQIRTMLTEDIRDLGGDRIVEADETWIGGRISKMNAARRKRPAKKVRREIRLAEEVINRSIARHAVLVDFVAGHHENEVGPNRIGVTLPLAESRTLETPPHIVA
jgi:hypothetical protein